MWLNITMAKVAPENADKVIEILNREESRQPFQAAPGFRFLLGVESTDNPGEMLSLSFWDTEDEGQAFYNSDQYRRVVGGIASLLVARPERHFYTVRMEYQAAHAAAAD
jgi:heme-degrading monooxygenase HmoA